MSVETWDESYPPSLFVPPVVPITGVTAGSPGAFVPANAEIPANLVALQGDPVVGNGGTNKPGAAWTVGQYVVLGDASEAYWSGVSWLSGRVPAEEEPEAEEEREEDAPLVVFIEDGPPPQEGAEKE